MPERPGGRRITCGPECYKRYDVVQPQNAGASSVDRSESATPCIPYEGGAYHPLDCVPYEALQTVLPQPIGW